MESVSALRTAQVERSGSSGPRFSVSRLLGWKLGGLSSGTVTRNCLVRVVPLRAETRVNTCIYDRQAKSCQLDAVWGTQCEAATDALRRGNGKRVRATHCSSREVWFPRRRVTNQMERRLGAGRQRVGRRGWSGETIYSEFVATGLRVPWRRQCVVSGVGGREERARQLGSSGSETGD